jgi:YkoY family integral membrane protein
MEIGGVEIQQAITIIINLIIIESLLSIDNAAVLATMVMDLPPKDRKKALKIGLVIGYILRGACLVLASVLMKVWWLKLIGGGYLFALALNHFLRRQHTQGEDGEIKKKESRFYTWMISVVGWFWATVLLVESMDLMFSIDNVLAAAAFTNVLWLVIVGVFIGILAMRFLAGVFVDLMAKYPFLETSAYLVLLLLGLKLMAIVPCHLDMPAFSTMCYYLEGEEWHHKINGIFSGITISIFALPMITSWLFNFPKKGKPGENYHHH